MMDGFRSRSWWVGIGLAVSVSVVAGYSAEWFGEYVLGFEKSPVSAIMMAIIIGMIIANTIKLPDGAIQGLRFCTSTIMRIGIMLLGIRLSLMGAGRFTLVALPFVVVAITVGLTTVGLVGHRMGMPKWLSGLIAVGTSICGVTAIVAIAPLIRAKEPGISYAVACITIFGVLAMLFYPIIAYYAFADQPVLAGLFLGTSIHDTAQVAGAGMMYEAQYDAPVALEVATVTKLVRNLGMIAVIPFVGLMFGSDKHAGESSKGVKLLSMIPWFIVGFAVMSAFRSIGDIGDRAFGVLDQGQWHATIEFTRHAAAQFLLVAMSAVGLTTLFVHIINIGMRPFVLGLFAALLVGGVSFTLISLFAEPLIRMVGL
jgi:uncharacterized integral membrane protein (TIGR00698 family)